MSLTTNINLALKALQIQSDDFGSPTDNPTFTFPNPTQLASGTASGQADIMYHARLTIAGTTTTSLDLNGSLTDEFGGAVNFARIKVLAAYNRSTNNGDVLVFGGGANAWEGWNGTNGSKFKVAPSGMELKVAPLATAFAVTAGTGDILRIVSEATNNVSLDLMLIGASA